MFGFGSLLGSLSQRPPVSAASAPSRGSSQDILTAVRAPQEHRLFRRIAEMSLKQFQDSCFWSDRDVDIEINVLDGNILDWHLWTPDQRCQRLVEKDQQHEGRYSKNFRAAAESELTGQFKEFLWKPSDESAMAAPVVLPPVVLPPASSPTVPPVVSSPAAKAVVSSPVMFPLRRSDASVMTHSLIQLSGVSVCQEIEQYPSAVRSKFTEDFCQKYRAANEESLGFVTLWDRAEEAERKRYINDFNTSSSAAALPSKGAVDSVRESSARTQYLRSFGK